MTLAAIGTATRDEVRALFREIEEAEPDEVMVVYMKAGEVCTRSNGTFSRMRTLGALEILKFDLLNSDSP